MSTDTVETTDRLLVVDDLCVHFGGIKAVDEVSLTLDGGLIYGVLGPNGSGKSTMLAALTRMLEVTRGAMQLDGVDYTNDAPSSLASKGIGRTFQTVRLLEDLTVGENILLGSDLRVSGWAKFGIGRPHESAAERNATDAIDRTGVSGYLTMYPSELSYGLQRRVEIARALAMSPRLLLLDEPTAGMTKTERADIAALMTALRSEGLTQVLVEHDVQMMVDTCDYLFAMNTGRVIAQGAPVDVVRSSLVQEAYLGRKADSDVGNQ